MTTTPFILPANAHLPDQDFAAALGRVEFSKMQPSARISAFEAFKRGETLGAPARKSSAAIVRAEHAAMARADADRGLDVADHDGVLSSDRTRSLAERSRLQEAEAADARHGVGTTTTPGKLPPGAVPPIALTDLPVAFRALKGSALMDAVSRVQAADKAKASAATIRAGMASMDASQRFEADGRLKKLAGVMAAGAGGSIPRGGQLPT